MCYEQEIEDEFRLAVAYYEADQKSRKENLKTKK